MSDLRPTINLLGNDVELTGSITLKQDCTIDGTLKGTITSEAAVIIGENAEIHADIKARSVVVMGRVTGNVQVLDKHFAHSDPALTARMGRYAPQTVAAQ